MTGIYKITNRLNGKAYIGYAKDIEDRFKTHKSRAFYENKEYNKTLYRAFRKYGLDNFDFKVLLECEEGELKAKEIELIAKHRTYTDGYNETCGGEGVSSIGENHPNSKLTERDIINIRTRYANRERKMEVRKLYPNIGDSGFNKVWKGETWKHIMPEVYSEENIEFHKLNTAMVGSNNGRTKLSEQDVYTIRTRKKNGENWSVVYEDYKDRLTSGSFKNIWSYQNWKSVIV